MSLPGDDQRAGKPPQLAVIGCGNWGKNLVRNFHELGVLKVVCDLTEVGRQTASKVAPGCAIEADIDSVLRSPVEGVVIATPAITHFDLGRRALEAGKDVFVEKPLALTAEEGESLVRLAAHHGRVLMVGHVLEYHPAVQKLKDVISAGELGKIQYIYSNRLSLGKVRREENILWSFAPHDVALILRLMGGLPFEVVACGGSYLQPNIADVTLTHFLFDHGVRAHIHVSWLHPFKEQRLVVIGERKMVAFDDVGKKLTMFDQRPQFPDGAPITGPVAGTDLDYSKDEPLRLECEAFVSAVQTRKPPLTDGASGLRVLQVLQAAQRSLIMNGEPVRLPSEGTRFDVVPVA